MNDTAPHPRKPHIPGPRQERRVPYPRRINYDEPGKTGIILGPTQRDITAAQRWVHDITRQWGFTPTQAGDAASVTVALVANAHQHTASGLPGGETTLTLEYGPFLTHLWVKDQGPRPSVIRPPLPHLRPDKSGLLLVETVAVYWDWQTLPPGIVVRAALETPPNTQIESPRP